MHEEEASEKSKRYSKAMRSLIRKYITNEQRVTEDDCNEIK